jgi:hypothetical protein
MEAEQKDIEVTATVAEFFYERVKNAVQKQKTSLSETSEWYAVNLLSRYAAAYDTEGSCPTKILIWRYFTNVPIFVLLALAARLSCCQ